MLAALRLQGKLPTYPPGATVQHEAVALIVYCLHFLEGGRVSHLPYAGGLLDQPADLMELLYRVAATISSKG